MCLACLLLYSKCMSLLLGFWHTFMPCLRELKKLFSCQKPIHLFLFSHINWNSFINKNEFFFKPTKLLKPSSINLFKIFWHFLVFHYTTNFQFFFQPNCLYGSYKGCLICFHNIRMPKKKLNLFPHWIASEWFLEPRLTVLN